MTIGWSRAWLSPPSPPIPLNPRPRPPEVLGTPRRATMLHALITAAFVCAGPTTDQIATTLNLAGQQRTLTQQIAKDYLLIASCQNAVVNRETLSCDIESFEAVVGAIENGEVC